MPHREKDVCGHLSQRDVNRWIKRSESGRRSIQKLSEPAWQIQVISSCYDVMAEFANEPDKRNPVL